MKKIFIHCGMPKTGSSALQVQLAQSREVFRKHGYDYLATGVGDEAKDARISSGNGMRLAQVFLPEAHRLSNTQNRDAVVAETRQFISEAKHNVILSSEFFTAISAKQMGEMVAAISDLGKVQLVYFVREQVSALASTYIQSVKRSMQTTFPDEFFAELISGNPKFSAYSFLSYNTYFKNLTTAAHDATVLVKPYELSKDFPMGLMGLFLNMIGAKIPVEDLPKDSHINLSPSPLEVRFMLEVNKYRPRMQFSDMVVEASRLAERTNIFTYSAIIPPEAATSIKVFFEAENEAFFVNFGKCDNIYQNTNTETQYIDLRNVTYDAADVMEMLSGILVKMDQRIANLAKDVGRKR